MWPTLIAMLVAAPVCRHVTVEATLDVSLENIHGEASCEVGQAGPLFAATYPRVLQDPNAAALTDITRTWFYPNGFNPAGMQLWQGEHALEGNGPWQALGTYQVGDVVRLRFVTTIPTRNGTFGRHSNTAFLLGGWHPAFGRDNSLEPTDIDYRVQVPPGRVGFVGHKPYGRHAARERQGHTFGRFVPLLATWAMQTQQDGHTVLVTPMERGGDITDRLDETARAQLLQTLRDGDAFAAQHGVPMRNRLVVQTPIFEHLVEPFDDGLAVSPRAFHLLAHELFRKFHRATVWREQFDLLLASPTRHTPGTLSSELVADALGVALREQLVRERYGKTKYLPELLETIAIIPEIDTLIFAPALPFIDTYYAPVSEAPVTRWGLDNFYHQRPRGKLLFEKLVDRLGDQTVQNSVNAYLSHQQDNWLVLLQKATPENVAAILKPWLATYPQLNYGIADVVSDAKHTTLTIVADGPDAHAVVEPISVEFTDARRQRHVLQRLGPGPLSATIPGPVHRLRLDPDNRLGQTWHPPGFDSHFDDTVPPQWRFLLDDISGVYAVTNQQISARVDFSLRRLHDLTYSLDTGALYSPFNISGYISGNYHFGSEVTPLQLSDTFTFTLAYEHLRPGYVTSIAGDQLAVTASYLYDTRISRFASLDGFALDAYASFAAGISSTRQKYQYTQIGAGILRILPIAFNYALLVRLRGDMSVGDTPAQDQFALGGRYLGARGYEIDEALANRRAVLSGELRHVLTSNGRTDVFGLLLMHRLEGALFADAAYVPVNRDGCAMTNFYDVGYSLRVLADVFNVSPAAMSIDVGYPLTRCPDQATIRFPVTVYLAFVQSFLAF